MEQERKPDAGTVVGVAKTRLDGRTVYLDILYGNRVILPDGTESSIEPAIYERILKEYLQSGGEEKEIPRREEKKEEEQEKYFRSEEEYVLHGEGELTAGQEESARKLREDRNSFFYREEKEEEEEPDEVLMAADDEDGIPLARLSDPGRRRKDGRLFTGLLVVIGALCLLLLLLKLGII